MGKLRTFIELVRYRPYEIGRVIDSYISQSMFSRLIPSPVFLKMRYTLCIHKKLNLQNPKGFNEKLQWLKLYYYDARYEMLADKYKVKEYVNLHFPEVNTIKTIGVWKKVDDIKYDELPNSFVLKCTHDTGSTIICKNKKDIDKTDINQKLSSALKKNIYYRGREWVYKNIEPLIIAEEYMEDDTGKEMLDYKFMCFNGTVKCCFVCSDRFSKEGLHVTFFDREWNVMPFTRHYPKKEYGIPKPDNLSSMIDLAERMAKGMPFVRIDFYSINKKIYFGEYTFFPGSGLEEFTPPEYDNTLGEWILLPEKNMNCN